METSIYKTKPSFIDVIEVTEDNIEEVARWCGGDVRKNRDGDQIVVFPTLEGLDYVMLGDALARDIYTGIFFSITKEHLTKDFDPAG